MTMSVSELRDFCTRNLLFNTKVPKLIKYACLPDIKIRNTAFENNRPLYIFFCIHQEFLNEVLLVYIFN